MKVSGVSKVQAEFAYPYPYPYPHPHPHPYPRDHALVPELILRALRLNCLTADYAPLWEELFDPAWRHDSWTREIPSPPLGDIAQELTMTTPLRRDAERRQAHVEIDALAAVMLGISAEELCAIYPPSGGGSV